MSANNALFNIHAFFNALVFFTRIPAPAWVKFDAGHEHRAAAFAPLIGCIVGALSGSILVLADLVFPLQIALILSMIASVTLTGALHEDGFADVCDGFGASRERDTILKIMKDSRIGVYGALGIGLILLLKLAALSELVKRLDDWTFVLLFLVAAHSLSRLLAVAFIFFHDYVAIVSSAKSTAMTAPMRFSDLCFAIACALVPLLGISWLGIHWVFVILLPMLLAFLLLARLFNARLGGYTGDCLGCAQQVGELVFYLSACVILPVV